MLLIYYLGRGRIVSSSFWGFHLAFHTIKSHFFSQVMNVIILPVAKYISSKYTFQDWGNNHIVSVEILRNVIR